MSKNVLGKEEEELNYKIYSTIQGKALIGAVENTLFKVCRTVNKSSAYKCYLLLTIQLWKKYGSDYKKQRSFRT